MASRSFNPPPVSLSITETLTNLRNAISNHPSPTSPSLSLNQISRSASNLNSMSSNPSQNDRMDIIDAYVRQRRSEYEVKQQFTIYAGTWNTNGQFPSEDLRPWLSLSPENGQGNGAPGSPKNSSPKKKSNSISPTVTSDFKNPDMYVLGFQELDLTKDAYIYANSTLEREWTNKIEKTIDLRKYYKVKVHRLAGIMIAIFVKSSKMRDIKDVHFATVGTGLMNQFGNKGGVAVSMKIKDTSVCFLSAHLAAQMDNVTRRNQDYQNIINRMFKDNIDGRPLRLDEYDTAKTINNHDVIIWVGDLNYRIYAHRMTDDELMARLEKNKNINEKDLESRIAAYTQIIHRADQLFVEKNESRMIFENFHEKEISFPPTYKFDIGTYDTYDTSEKRRQPAWTDRILYRHSNNQVRSVNNYRSHMSHRISDHKPVSAEITMDICAVDPGKKRIVQSEVIKQLDVSENANRPSCTMSAQSLDFGTVLFREPIKKVITVTNDGNVAFNFSISLPMAKRPGFDANNHKPYLHRSTSNSEVYLPDWLKINIANNSDRVILPGQSRDLIFTVNVDTTCVRSLSIGLDKIDTILLFSMKNGGDKFLTVSGDFKPSCFGLTLEELSRLENTPIGQLTTQQVNETCCRNLDDSPADQLINLQPEYIQNFTQEELDILGLVPKEFYKLCHKLAYPSKKDKNKEIFLRNPPGAQDARDVFDQLDNQTFGEKLSCKSQHGVAEQFLVFLSALPEKVIPRSYYVLVLDHSDTLENANKALNCLPKVHKAVFLHVMATLKTLLSDKETNLLTEEFVTTLFSSLLLVPPDSMVRELQEAEKQQALNNGESLIDFNSVVGFDWALAKTQAKNFISHYLRE